MSTPTICRIVKQNGITDDQSEPGDLIAKLHDIAPRLNDKDDREAKRVCLQISKALTAQLEQPENIAVDLAFSPMIAVSARLAIDLNLFEYIVQYGPVTSARLASLSGAEELLIIRILRLLSTVHFAEEASPRAWRATRTTRVMATKEIAAGHRIISQLVVPAMQNAPSFSTQHGYSSPTDPRAGLVQFAFNTDQLTFEHIAANTSLLKDFNLFMGNSMGARRYWFDWYPVQSRILDGATADTALIVDIGAGKGHDLLAFARKFSNVGRLVLQDLPAVVDGLHGALGTAIEVVAYDFFAEQPIQGARAYFYHHIFHDWSDNYCLEILSRVVAAMTPGYSKLLLHEMLVPEQGASQFHAQMDITMMAFNGGMERTRQQWQTLLEAVGLQIVKFWDPVDEGADGIVKAVRI